MIEQMKILALFPGQGSQKVGMGKELYDTYPKARELFDEANEILGFSLSSICFDGPEDKLTATEVVQPAILTVSTICFELARETWGDKVLIGGAAGHSLGEYSALVSAGALLFADAVLLVHKRGKYMQDAVPRGAGKMMAVMGVGVAELEEKLKSVSGVAQIANINAPGQIVVSGEAAAIDRAKEALAGARVVELAVSAPFHCDLMKPAADRLAADLDKTALRDAIFPVYANIDAGPATAAATIRENLKRQVCGRVQWVASMERAISDIKPVIAVEFGAGNVLGGLLKRINKDLKRAAVDSKESAAALIS